MSYGGDDDETLRLRVVYEASQVVKEAIADIRQLKEETGELNKEQEKTLQTLEYQKNLLEGAGSGLDHYTALVNEEVQAQKYYHQVLDETNESLKAQANAQFELDQIVARNQATIQASTADFSKLGGQIMAAEKAAQAIVSGHGLGRIGGMLEKVTLAVGGPAGLGMALGAVAMALEGMLPKIQDWLLKWETGSKTIDEVKKALDSLDKSEEEHDRKRALRKVERQISRLEKKEDEQGFLTGMEREDLDRLEAAAFNMRQKMAAAKKVEGIGGGKEAKARGGAGGDCRIGHHGRGDCDGAFPGDGDFLRRCGVHRGGRARGVPGRHRQDGGARKAVCCEVCRDFAGSEASPESTAPRGQEEGTIDRAGAPPRGTDQPRARAGQGPGKQGDGAARGTDGGRGNPDRESRRPGRRQEATGGGAGGEAGRAGERASGAQAGRAGGGA
jgi:hypothetical protein